MSEANKPEKKATFIATVRIDIKDLARLARFLSNRNIYVETRSKVASEALRIMARGTPDGQDITTAKQATLELEMLGYSETLNQDKRYHGALFSEIEVEEASEVKQAVTEQAVAEYMQAEQERANAKVKVQTTLTQAENMTNSPLVSEDAQTELDGTRQEAEEYRQRMEDGIIDPTTAKAGIKTRASSADLADINQKSSNEAKQMRASLGQIPDIEVEGDDNK